MRHIWIKRRGSDRLILFFNGWGQDERAVAHLATEADVLMLYAYHDGADFDFSGLAAYRTVDLAAWSMGVWRASAVLWPAGLAFRRAIALCGTMTPVGDRQGIPDAVFEATLRGLSPRTLEKFNIRMAGGLSAYRASPLYGGGRDFSDVRDELAWWAGRKTAAAPGCIWQTALIGTQDGIFPPENQRRAWAQTGVRTVERESPHYPMGKMTSWEDVFGI